MKIGIKIVLKIVSFLIGFLLFIIYKFARPQFDKLINFLEEIKIIQLVLLIVSSKAQQENLHQKS